MNLEQNQYTVAGFNAIQIYPFSKISKRYYRGFHTHEPNQLYRIVCYPHSQVKVEPLINTLKILKTLNNEILGKILNIYEETKLIKVGQKPQEQTVIAVVLKDDFQKDFICLYDFIIQMGSLSEKLAKDFVFKLLNFIRYMEQNGFCCCFSSNDIFIEKKTGQIKIDNYGDSRHFNLKQQTISDVWELGSFLFTILKGNPPYNKKTQSDPHYNCLNKGQFQKFWGFVPQKPVKNPSQQAINFINTCFEKQSTISKMLAHEWIDNYIPVTDDQRTSQILSLIAAKQERLQMKQIQHRIRVQKMHQAARERSCLIQRRGTHSQLIETFLDNLLLEQDRLRSLNKQTAKEEEIQKAKIKIAQLLTILTLNEDKHVKISDIRNNKNSIIFKINAQLVDGINVDSEVQLSIEKYKDSIQFICSRIQGSFYQSLWVHNYIKELCMQI